MPHSSDHAAGSKKPLWVLLSVVVVDLVGFGVVLPILPYFAKSFGASPTVLGLLLTCYAFMQFLFAPAWGRLSDRIGRRPVMLLTIAGGAGSLLLLGLTGSLLWIFVARILGGLFAANISVATAYITDETSDEERTRWMGLIGAAFGVGFLLGPALGGTLARFGYHVPLLAAAALATINLVYAAFVLREPRRHRPRADKSLGALGALRQGAVGRLCAINFVFTFAVSQLETVFAFFMIDRFAWDAPQVAYILVLMALIMALLQGGGMRPLSRRFGERRLLLVGAALLAASFAAVPWSRPVLVLLIPLSISAVGRALVHPSLLSLASKSAAAEHRGAVMGTFQSSASLARVAGPTAAGLLYDRSLPYPFLLAGVLMIVVVLLAGPRQTLEP